MFCYVVLGIITSRGACTCAVQVWVEIHVLLGAMVHVFNPSTQETEAGGYLLIQGQSCLHSEFQVNQDYMVRDSVQKYVYFQSKVCRICGYETQEHSKVSYMHKTTDYS